MRTRWQMYFWQEKQPFNWNKVCIFLARLTGASYRWIKAFFKGFVLHTVTHTPSRRFPRTCNRCTLIEFLCRVTWLSVAIIHSSPWPVTSVTSPARQADLRQEFESQDNQLCSSLKHSFNKSIDFRSHRSASEKSCRGRTALITGISFVWKSLQQKTNAWGKR